METLKNIKPIYWDYEKIKITETQILKILYEAETGCKVVDVCREYEISFMAGEENMQDYSRVNSKSLNRSGKS